MRILPAGVHCHLSRTYRTKLVSEHSLLIEDAYLPSMAAAFMNELQNRDDDYRNIAQAQFLALLWRLRRRLQNDVPVVANTMKSFEAPRQSAAHKVQLPSTMPPHQRAIFEKIDEYIGLHLQEPLTLMQLAEQAGLSLAQLNRLFHSACGTSVMRHVSQRRLYAACFLLEAHNLSVQEIARLCGYSHASHFCHVFAQKFHLTPLEYRRRHRQ
jgi:transcriptional regulator GlxA family with amidase domain